MLLGSTHRFSTTHRVEHATTKAETKKATGPGAAAGSNFAGRSPPNTSPFIDRFLATKDVWVKFLGHDMFRVQYAYA